MSQSAYSRRMGWRRLGVDLLDACQSCRDPAAFASWTLERIQSILGFDSAIMVSRTTGSMLAQVNKRPYLHLLQNLTRDRARYAETLGRPRTAVYLDTEVFSARERRTLPFYVDIVRPQGITAQVSATSDFQQQSQSVMYLCRHDGARFRERQLEALRRIVPLIGLAQAALAARRPTPPPLEMTPREEQITGYLCRGFRNQDIARVLGTSPSTVRNQLQRLFEKAGVSSRTELAVALLRRNAG